MAWTPRQQFPLQLWMEHTGSCEGTPLLQTHLPAPTSFLPIFDRLPLPPLPQTPPPSPARPPVPCHLALTPGLFSLKLISCRGVREISRKAGGWRAPWADECLEEG